MTASHVSTTPTRVAATTSKEDSSPIEAVEVGSTCSMIDPKATRLISSPYSDIQNQLILHDLELPYQLFAFALTALRPVRADYATAPYLESFNWTEVFSLLRELCKQTGYEWKERTIYTVIFRSTLLPGTDRERLGLLDQKSHEEACASGGLLKYWFGNCDEQLRNLATCRGFPPLLRPL